MCTRVICVSCSHAGSGFHDKTCKNRAVQIEVHKIDTCLELSYLHIAMLSSDSPELFSPCAQRRVVPIHLGWKRSGTFVTTI